MNNRQKITLIIAIVLVVLIYFIVRNMQSYHRITFTIEPPATGVVIQNKSDGSKGAVDIKKITTSQTLYLQDGEYQYIPEGEAIDSSLVSFAVDGENKEIKVHPNFSAQYLSDQLVKELPKINTIIIDKYSSIMSDYEINNAILIGDTNWAGVIITPKNMDANNPTTYFRAVLKKEGDTWRIMNKPEVVLTIYNSPDINREILQQINNLSPL